MAEATKQIFVRAVSRSGGTLVVTLLDAHPAIAMSYELYDTLLEPERNRGLEAAALRRRLAFSRFLPRWLQLASAPTRDLQTFVGRLRRGGLSLADFHRLLGEHIARGRALAARGDRLKLIEACAVLKKEREGKAHWGLKCTSAFEDYQQAFDNPYFINVIRDGRDVLASQLRTGRFKTSPEKLGQAWAQTHRRFREWRREPGVRGYELFYEKLAHEPEAETRRLCAFLGVDFEPRMLAFHESKLSIFDAGHLSIKRISSPIDTTMIGRWRQDLAAADAEAFCRAAGDAMTEFGYLPAPASTA